MCEHKFNSVKLNYFHYILKLCFGNIWLSDGRYILVIFYYMSTKRTGNWELVEIESPFCLAPIRIKWHAMQVGASSWVQPIHFHPIEQDWIGSQLLKDFFLCLLVLQLIQKCIHYKDVLECLPVAFITLFCYYI